jgi:acetoin utilization protein AcuB
VTGQAYRGTLEGLGTVTGLTAARRARGIDREGEELGPEAVPSRRAESATQEEAGQAYQRMLEQTPERDPIHHVYQIMSREVMTLPASADVASAWRGLLDRGVGQAPVLDADGRLVGMVGRDDLMTVLNLAEGAVRDPLGRNVADVMSSPVVSADPSTSVRRVARVMIEFDLSGVPVVNEQDELVGIVTRGDILRAVMNEPPLNLWA